MITHELNHIGLVEKRQTMTGNVPCERDQELQHGLQAGTIPMGEKGLLQYACDGA